MRRIQVAAGFVAISALCSNLLFAQSEQRDPTLCASCGLHLGRFVYIMEDMVTHEKVNVCAPCELNFADCYICGLPASTNIAGFAQLSDGRVLCGRDAKTAVLREDEGIRLCGEVRNSLDRLFSRFMTFPENDVKLAIADRVHLRDLYKLSGNDYHCPNTLGYTQFRTNHNKVSYNISIMSGLPRAEFQATCAHEYTHAWVNEHISSERRETLGLDAEEGFCELIGYLLMDSQHEETQKNKMLHNAYTRGQIDLFIDAERRFGFNEVVDWIQHGEDEELSASEPGRIRRVVAAHRTSTVASALTVYQPAPVAAPTNLVLRAIFWDPNRPSAVINDRTFAPNEQGKVRLGTTNVNVRCLTIRKEGVRVRLLDSAEERELTLQPARH